MAQAKELAQSLNRDYDIGGARALPFQVVSRSRVVFSVGPDAIITLPDVAIEPIAGQTGFFFRDRGDGKQQFCVRFGSGAIQILASEP